MVDTHTRDKLFHFFSQVQVTMRKPFNEIGTKYGFFSIQSLNLYLIYRIALDPGTQSRLTLYFIQIHVTQYL